MTRSVTHVGGGKPPVSARARVSRSVVDPSGHVLPDQLVARRSPRPPGPRQVVARPWGPSCDTRKREIASVVHRVRQPPPSPRGAVTRLRSPSPSQLPRTPVDPDVVGIGVRRELSAIQKCQSKD
jgi:hypothetical protein